MVGWTKIRSHQIRRRCCIFLMLGSCLSWLPKCGCQSSCSWPPLICTIKGVVNSSRLHLKCDGTNAEIRFRLSVKRMSQLNQRGHQFSWKLAAEVCASAVVMYTMFRGSVKSTDCPLHSPVSPSLSLLCVTVCHHISTGLYHDIHWKGNQYKYCALLGFNIMK